MFTLTNTIRRHFILNHLEKVNVHKNMGDMIVENKKGKDESWNSISLLHCNVLQNRHLKTQNGFHRQKNSFPGMALSQNLKCTP